MKFFSIFFFASTVLLCIFVQAPSAEIKPLSSALHVLPPVGSDAGDVNDLDKTLTKFLKISVCEVTRQGTCTSVITFTSHSGTAYLQSDSIPEGPLPSELEATF